MRRDRRPVTILHRHSAVLLTCTIRQMTETAVPGHQRRFLAGLSEVPTDVRPHAHTGGAARADQRWLLISSGFLAVLCVASIVDLVLDRPARLFSLHVMVELLIVLTAGASALLLGLRGSRALRDLRELDVAYLAQREELGAWRARVGSLREGLARSIEDQLLAWGLTATEREIAYLLLEGYAHKEIASATSRSDRTVRQHAAAVYRKSGLSGRAELSAFFLMGLLTETG